MKKALKVMKEGIYYRLGFEGGGELPDSLKGLYTSAHIAEKAIGIHLAKKSTVDGKGNARA